MHCRETGVRREAKKCAGSLPFSTPNPPPLVPSMDSTNGLSYPRAPSWAQ